MKYYPLLKGNIMSNNSIKETAETVSAVVFAAGAVLIVYGFLKNAVIQAKKKQAQK
jgi:hypothetical protein